VARAHLESGCTPLLSIDGEQLGFSFSVDGRAIIDGSSVFGVPCDGPVALGAGSHVVTAVDGDVVVDVDRVVLAADGLPDDVVGPASPPVATVVDGDKFRRTVEVTGCSKGCWLVFGEGFSTGWKASVGGRPLGEPELVDGGFNGWWLEPSDSPVEVDVRWTRQRPLDIALALSALGAVVAMALVVIDRRRGAAATVHARSAPPVLELGNEPIPRRRAIVVAVAWAALAGLLIAPVWVLWGAIAGAAIAVWRRVRVAELVALATLITVAVLVTVRERRNAPAPNGGWPAVFESWHRLAMFAVVAVAVAAIGATDSDGLDDEGDGLLGVDEADQPG
jgi:arabinofuranan 3-O-arabinosyltransferase